MLLLKSSDLAAAHVYQTAPFHRTAHHCLLSLLCSSESHLNLLQTPQQQRAGDAPATLPAVSARQLRLINMCCQSLLPASSCRQRSSLGRFPVHLISKPTPILFHMLINCLPSCSQPFLLSSSLPRAFKTSRPYWHTFVGKIFKFQSRVAAHLSQPETKL